MFSTPLIKQAVRLQADVCFDPPITSHADTCTENEPDCEFTEGGIGGPYNGNGQLPRRGACQSRWLSCPDERTACEQDPACLAHLPSDSDVNQPDDWQAILDTDAGVAWLSCIGRCAGTDNGANCGDEEAASFTDFTSLMQLSRNGNEVAGLGSTPSGPTAFTSRGARVAELGAGVGWRSYQNNELYQMQGPGDTITPQNAALNQCLVLASDVPCTSTVENRSPFMHSHDPHPSGTGSGNRMTTTMACDADATCRGMHGNANHDITSLVLHSHGGPKPDVTAIQKIFDDRGCSDNALCCAMMKCKPLFAEPFVCDNAAEDDDSGGSGG